MQTENNSRKAHDNADAKSGNNNNRHRNSSQDTPKWEVARAANAGNTIVDAKVESVATKDGRPRGLNVILDCGLPSFIPGSELPKGCDQKGLVGTTIKVRIVEVNRRKGRLISSLKSVVDEERGSFITTLEEEMEVTGTVLRFNKEIGYFVDLGHGVDALLHLSQTALVDGKPEVLTIGQSVTARVRSINVEKGQVALTMRKPRQEQAHGGNRRNVERFQTRTSKQAATRALQLPKATPAAVKVEKPKGPRQLNTNTPRARKSGFEVSFTSEGGNPFAQLKAFYDAKSGTGADEQTAEVPTEAAAPETTAPAVE